MEPEASTSYLPPHPTPLPPSPRTSRRIRRRREEGGGVDGSPINTRSSNRPPSSNLSSNPPHPHSQPSPTPPHQLFTPSNRGTRSLRSRVLTSMGVLLALPSQTLAFPFLSPRSKPHQQQPLEPQPPAPLPTPPPAAFPSRKGKERETVGVVRRGAGLSKRDSTGKVIPDRYTPAADGSGSWDLDLGWELFGVSPSVQRDLAEEQTSPSSTITATPSSSSQTAASTSTSSSTTTTSITYPRDWENTGNTRDAFELPLIIACTVSLAILVILTVATFIARRNKRSRRSKREKRRATSASRDSTVSVDIAGMKEKALQEEEARLRGGKWKGGVVGVLKSAGGGRKFLRRRKGKKAKVGAVGDSVVEEEGSQDGRGSTSLDGGEGERVRGDGTPAVRSSNEERTDEGNEEPSSTTSPRLSEDRSRSPPPPSTPPLSPLNALGSALPTITPSSSDPTTSTNLPTSPSTTSLLSISAPAPPSPPPPHSNQTVPPTYRASTMAGASPSAASSSTARPTHLALPSISTLPPLPSSPTTPHGFPVDDKRPFPPSSSSQTDDLPPLEPSPSTHQHQPSSPSLLPTSHHHHLATDDKSALARLASQASAPDDPSSSSHDQEGSAPAWRDEDDDDDQLPESVLQQSAATPSAIPAPPRPWGEKTMEDPYLPPLDLDDAPEPLEGTHAPSAPMMNDDEQEDGEEASAPPLEMDEDDEEERR